MDGEARQAEELDRDEMDRLADLAALDRRQDSLAEDLIDGVLPAEFRWRRFVRNYPLPALAIAALGGYWLGRTRGRGIAAALSALAADQLVRGVNNALGDEFL